MNILVKVPEVEDELFDFIAEQQVAAGDTLGSVEIADLFLTRKGVEDPAICLLARRGMSVLISQNRAWERLQLKVMQLDPEFYNRLDAKRQQETLTPRQIANRELKAKVQEQERRREYQKTVEAAEKSYRRMKAAFEFYDRWHMPDGTQLGDADRSKLLAVANQERLTAAGHEKNATFYEALAEGMEDGQTVRDAVPLDRAHRLREQIFATVPAMAAE